MKKYLISFIILACIVGFISCEKEELSFTEGDIQIEIETGEHWLHDFPLLLGISKKNPPQFAIWLEDKAGNYISTVFATYKIATEGWQSNNGNRRKEALPYWCHQRGVVSDDGLLLPTKANPLTDGITGATPKENKTLQLRIRNFTEPIVIKSEFNHSIDFNEFFPDDAKEGDANYSGGDMGSGQPAVIYAGTLNPGDKEMELQMIGYSSPDGSNGNINADMEKLTTAKTIVGKIIITIK
ncbi:MAG: hypothetical protein AUK44_06415 [Porphyromonadaceae bacterium CG2_30_38_12]|nr:MAG: hypothetical protein AUK44_06415 [Porphyromonadaceae bacterium CG2_30_38_12]